jgi:hypothetical protein
MARFKKLTMRWSSAALRAGVGNYYAQEGSTVRKHYYAGDQRIALRVNGTLYWLLTDHLGSTNVTLDASGHRVTELRYLPLRQAQGRLYGDLNRPHAATGYRGNSYSYPGNPTRAGDAVGNMITRTVSGVTYTLTYNAENRLTTVSGAVSASYTLRLRSGQALRWRREPRAQRDHSRQPGDRDPLRRRTLRADPQRRQHEILLHRRSARGVRAFLRLRGGLGRRFVLRDHPLPPTCRAPAPGGRCKPLTT